MAFINTDIEKGLGDLLDRNVEVQPDAPCLYYGESIITFADIHRNAERLAIALSHSGIQTGDRVAVMMLNRPEMVYAFFACFRLGVLVVPLNTRYKRREIAYALEHSGARALIVGANFFTTVKPLCAKEELHEHTIIVDGAEQGIEDWIDYDHFVNQSYDAIEWPEVHPDLPAVMLHTSGSTANPKGVIHSHRTLFHVARMNCNVYQVDKLVGPSLVYLSICYIGGLGWQLLRNMFAGKPCVFLLKKEPGELLKAFAKHKCSEIVLLPTDAILMIEHPDAAKMDWSSLMVMGSGGDKVSPDLQDAFYKLTGVRITEGYGMTECGPATVNLVYGPKVVGSMGKAVDGVELRITNAAKEVLPNGEVGDLWVKSPGNMVEYWNNPQTTAETLIDGWLKTGDLATCDENGYYWFHGRSKLIIVRGGSNIAPQEVEEVIDHHPAVMSCCVVGVPDPKWGEIVRAYVELHQDYSPKPTEDEIIEYARHHIATYKSPEQVILVDEMPTNSTGKMDRARMRKMATE
ncbi:class I adenylate-forming enzyme family protein [Rubellicoccus peritrichatus]|uniref:AMP-binding protein n=1 Tax=Rubellicoccus peritrichatus TaxID=3080537 RepID=A0AAQ3LAF4_9BACT|nr:AMP-binding protein [Puniceicoccus sp. CR14]WOO40330.1 AMP-binding protein [Puniceicoccus sp. CR14]